MVCSSSPRLTFTAIATYFICQRFIYLYSSSGGDLELVRKQAGHFSIGLIVLLITAQLPPRFYSSIAPWFYFVCLLGLLGVLLFGVGAKGAQRWLDLDRKSVV